jgi:hypothetical protein
MKETPEDVAQWAEEAHKGLNVAWMLLKGEHLKGSESELGDEQKSYLFKYGAALCSLNRGLGNKGRDKEKQKEIYKFSAKRVLAGFESDQQTQQHYELNFLIAYIDAHVGLGLLSEDKAEEIMLYLAENFEVN